MSRPSNRPPTWATRLLQWRLPAQEMELIDSLAEVYAIRVGQFGVAEARRLYWKDVLDLCVFGTGRFYDYATPTAHFMMYTHYLKLAWRTLRNQKAYAFINTAGLAFGLTICMLVFFFVRDEMTYDRFHEGADQIYRVNQMEYRPDGSKESEMTYTPYALGPALVNDFVQVETYTSLVRAAPFYVRQEGNIIQEDILFATEDFFQLFTFPLLHGDAETALQNPNSLVLSAAAAQRYFGDSNPVGQTLDVRFGDTYRPMTVSGVTTETPSNSSIQFDIVVPLALQFEVRPFWRRFTEDWGVAMVMTFVRLQDGATHEALQAQMPAFRSTYLPNEAENLRNDGYWEGDQVPFGFRLQPLTRMHIDPNIAGGLSTPSSPLYSYILSGIALAILLIACINFMTLSIGRSAKRSKEIGMRRVMGARRTQLIEQFLGEACLLSVASFLGAVGLTYAALPLFNALAEKELTFTLDPLTALVFIALALLTGLLAGSYPAFALSAFQPIDTLKNKLRLSGSNGFTKSLVVVQFALSIFLIVSTLVMQQQMSYTQTKDLGFNTDHVLTLALDGFNETHEVERLRQELGTYPSILATTAIDAAYTEAGRVELAFHEGETIEIYTKQVDPYYMDVLGGNVSSGRWFAPNRPADATDAVLVNETFVQTYGITNPVGRRLGEFLPRGEEGGPEIIGVLNDFNFNSLHSEISPLVFMQSMPFHGGGPGLGHLYIRVQPDNLPATLATIRTTWDALVPDVPVKLTFLDDDLQAYYVADARWSRIVRNAAFAAILIACLGLLGLAATTAANRTKEVGIRKVLGATIPQIISLLLRDFSLLVLSGFALAIPLIYIAMQRWLDAFAFRIDLGIGVFALGGLLALTLAVLTVGSQAFRAARVNPADSLRYE